MDSRTSNGANMLTEMMLAAQKEHKEQVEEARLAVEVHFRCRHRARVWLWHHFGWSWVLSGRYPWTKHTLRKVKPQ